MTSPRNALLCKRVALIGAIGLFIVGAAVVHTSSRLSSSELSALTALNGARVNAGASPLLTDWRLTLAARRQAQHIAETDEIAHTRTSNKGIFDSQAEPESRLASVFYFDRGAEALGRSFVADPSHVVASLLDAPYHRIALLDPAVHVTGVGLTAHPGKGTELLDAAFTLGGYPDTPSPSIVVWPASGAQNVPAYFLPGVESPNPAPESKAVGYILTVQAATDQSLVPASFVLREKVTGEVVPGRVASSATDSNMLPQAVAFIPASPLKWSKAYFVEFAGKTGFGPVSKSWEFHTAKAPAFSLKLKQEARPGDALLLTQTSPVQPTHICYLTSPGAQVALTRVSSDQFQIRVSDCGANSCAVKVFIAASPGCSTPTATFRAMFGGKNPRTAPELIVHS